MIPPSAHDPSLSRSADITQVCPNNIFGKIWLFLWSLRTRVFILLLVAILSFGAGLQYWNQKMLFENEVRLADDKHLVTASHLALSLSRYARDVSLVFSHWAISVSAAEQVGAVVAEHTYLTEAMDIDGFTILSGNNTIESSYSLVGQPLALPDESVLELLRIGTNTALHGVQISNLQRIGDARYFILGYNLSNDRMAIGYLNIRYIKEVQQNVTFGELGHAAIFDAAGRSVAHPVPAVEENMMDASGLSIVARMMNRETGVGYFFSPPMNTDMIAGFTYVPETGWPVMVPQPIRELSASVEASLRSTNLFIIAVSLVLALFGWIMTRALVRPIHRFTAASLEISEGNYAVDLPARENSSLEMWRLNEALKIMVEQIVASKERLQVALEIEEIENKRKGEFLIIASHELRNPLSGVVGMLAACKETTEDEIVTRYLDIANRSAMQLNAIVDDMIHFAEEQTDITPINLESFDAGREFSQLAEIYGQQADAAGLQFHYTPSPDLDRAVITDRYRVFQIVGNLLENAVKYTEAGSVSLEASFEPGASDTDGWLDICVSDTGIGIDAEALERIFEPFYQVDGSYSRSYNGLGIGLSISKSMVDRLAGRLQCKSEVGKGSAFHLRIPVQTSDPNGHDT
jgi:signal transduction histidine kinase